LRQLHVILMEVLSSWVLDTMLDQWKNEWIPVDGHHLGLAAFLLKRTVCGTRKDYTGQPSGMWQPLCMPWSQQRYTKK
jgi:hypothetical protein